MKKTVSVPVLGFLLLACSAKVSMCSASVPDSSDVTAAAAEVKSSRPEKSARGLLSFTEVFVPEGQWLSGLSASFSTHVNSNYKFAIVEGISSEGYDFRISPMVGYAVSKNLVIGGRFGYERSLMRISGGGISVGAEDGAGISLSVDSYYSLKHSYEGILFLRQYIPFGSNKRFAIFCEGQLGLGGSQAKYAAHTPVKGTYETGFRASLNVTPGIVAFISNEVALELNVGVVGITYDSIGQIRNQVEEGNRYSGLASFKINILSIGLGLAIYI